MIQQQMQLTISGMAIHISMHGESAWKVEAGAQRCRRGASFSRSLGLISTNAAEQPQACTGA